MNKLGSIGRMTSIVLALCCLSLGAVAQEKMKDMKMQDTMMKATLQGSFLKQSMEIEKQFISLVEAVPQEKYNWRPAEGVRSIAESFLHVATGNYVMLRTMGGKMPEGVNAMQLEKSTTDKAAIIDAIKISFAAVNECVKNIPESDFGKEVDFFGNKMTMLDMIVFAATHQHETLGQSIAYARTNGVKPPWSRM